MLADSERQGQASGTDNRVDKGWRQKGLCRYPTEAIFNTLRSYGVQVDEQQFRDLCRQRDWMTIAKEWSNAWKGTGSFRHLPRNAARELWRRLSPCVSPAEYWTALDEVSDALYGGALPEDLLEALENLRHLHRKIPLENGRLPEAFLVPIRRNSPFESADVEVALDVLAEAHRWESAEELVTLVEPCVPGHGDLLRSYLGSLRNGRAEDFAALLAVAQDTSELAPRRLRALDLVASLDAWDVVAGCAPAIIEAAVAQKQYPFAAEVAEHLIASLDKLEDAAHQQISPARPRSSAPPPSPARRPPPSPFVSSRHTARARPGGCKCPAGPLSARTSHLAR